MEKARPKRPVGAFVIMLALGLAVYACSFITFPANSILPDYTTWLQQIAAGNFLAKIAWVFADWAEPCYQATALGGILMILGCVISLHTGKKSKMTFGVCYGTGLFYRILVAQLIAIVGSGFLYQGMFENKDIGFVPTFIAVASFTPAIVITYGGEWRKVFTAGILGIICGCPFAYFTYANFVQPWGLPGCVAWVTPMIVMGFVGIEVCRVLPWMKRQRSDPEKPAPEKKDVVVPGQANISEMNGLWFVKRVFTDFSEPNFYGNELSGLLFVLGGVISVFLNPKNPCYGDGNLFLAILASQLLASALGIFLYWHRYYELGWYNTFVPLASLTPAFLLFYGTSFHVLITAVIIGAVFMPPVADWIGRTVAKHHAGYIGSVVAMWILPIVFISAFNYIPGFGC